MSIDGTILNEAMYPEGMAKPMGEWVAIKPSSSIKFKAHVWKVGTLGTGGLRIMLNLDQEYIKEMAMLAECQHELIELEFEARQSETK